jgi:hypothetical protein
MSLAESGGSFLFRPGVFNVDKRAYAANLSRASSYLDVAQLMQGIDDGLFSISRRPFEDRPDRLNEFKASLRTTS